jgi:hypothetical protein
VPIRMLPLVEETSPSSSGLSTTASCISNSLGFYPEFTVRYRFLDYGHCQKGNRP